MINELPVVLSQDNHKVRSPFRGELLLTVTLCTLGGKVLNGHRCDYMTFYSGGFE